MIPDGLPAGPLCAFCVGSVILPAPGEQLTSFIQSRSYGWVHLACLREYEHALERAIDLRIEQWETGL